MIDEFAKSYLHDELRNIRLAMLGKLEGLSEHDVRRPLTPTGTNLLGLVKHLATWEAIYLGDVFGRPFLEPPPSEVSAPQSGDDMWASEDETRAAIVDRFRRVGEHADATIEALPIDAPGHVSWWPRPDVMLFNILVHRITETNRHAGHADILREQIDGSTRFGAGVVRQQQDDPSYWADRFAKIEHAASAEAFLEE